MSMDQLPDRMDLQAKVDRLEHENAQLLAGCQCRRCATDRGGWMLERSIMRTCPNCGDKRCPQADDHRNGCRKAQPPKAEIFGQPCQCGNPKPHLVCQPPKAEGIPPEPGIWYDDPERLPKAMEWGRSVVAHARDLARIADDANARAERFAQDSRDKARIIAEGQARLELARVDSKTLNDLGHAIGCCYCTDQGCYTAKPEELMRRAKELCAKEDQEWDYHAAIVDRDEARAEVARLQAQRDELAEALREIGNEARRVLIETGKDGDPMMMAPWVAGTAFGALRKLPKGEVEG